MYSTLVIVVTFNAMRWIERCIQSVINSTMPLDIYIIDNGSTDGTQNFIRVNFPFILFKQNLKNIGFGAANNLGLQFAIDYNYDYVYLLNQDAWIKSDTISKLIQTHKQKPSFGILSPMQMQANETQLDKDFEIIIKEAGLKDNIISTDRVMAAHWLISRECILSVGGFSPTFDHYGEDDNYCNRAIFKNFKIGIIPSAIAIHDRSDRKSSSDQIIFFAYIRTLVFLSDFKTSTSFAFYGFICDCIKYLFKGKKITFIKYIWLLLIKRKIIVLNKKKSLVDGAFLRIQNNS